jgi:hypothetical protein
MTAYTGSVLTTTGFGRQDDRAEVTVSVAWAADLTTADTLTVADAFPPGLKLLTEYVEIWGTNPDSNATQTFGFKLGTEADDNAFQVATVIADAGDQIHYICTTGIGTTFDDDNDIVITPTANCATAVSSGTFWVKYIGRMQEK